MNVEDFRHKTIEYNDVVSFFHKYTGKNVSILFDQYIKNAAVPKLSYELKKKGLKKWQVSCVWEDVTDTFEMPIRIYNKRKKQWYTLNVKAKEKSVLQFKGNAKKYMEFDTKTAYFKVIKKEEGKTKN